MCGRGAAAVGVVGVLRGWPARWAEHDARASSESGAAYVGLWSLGDRRGLLHGHVRCDAKRPRNAGVPCYGLQDPSHLEEEGPLPRDPRGFDKDAKFRLILIESRIHRLARYYKEVKAIPPNFKYEAATASTLVS
eukprot:scaffold94115_cov39-Tisochrysis_lutea.AAC.2